MQINIKDTKKAIQILKAINHPVRQRILDFIKSKGETIVGDIYTNLNLEQSVTSLHLKKLRDAKFIISKKQGRERVYSINEDEIEYFNQTVCLLVKISK
jgi:DNA-binding transcriptional ArsR family regulator